MTEVGIRLLKNRLGGYLDQVRNGATIVVTHRGKPVARIEPIADGADLPESIRRLVADGRAVDRGRPGRIGLPRVALQPGGKSMADYVAEQRR